MPPVLAAAGVGVSVDARKEGAELSGTGEPEFTGNVAESVVREWIDVFVVGGAMALSGLAAAGAPSYSPDPDLLMRRQAPLGRPRQKRAQRAPKKFLRSKSPK